MDAGQTLPAETMCSGSGAEVLWGWPGKGTHTPSEAKAKSAERLLKQTQNRKDLAKSARAGYLAAAEWMESVISKMLGAGNWGLFGETTVSRLP